MEKANSFLRSTLMDISDLSNHNRSSRSKNQTFHFGINQKGIASDYNNSLNLYQRNIFQ
jgi:hypothetical protein